MSDIDKLLEIMARLRDKDRGCPWDLEQNFESIAPYTIEEACEVADAIERGAMAELPDELGDLLFQVVFYAQMGREADLFDFEDVVAAICEKMIRRHPHVFGDAERGDAALQLTRWEEIKATERAHNDDKSALSGVPTTLAGLTRASKIGKKAAKVGFDWPNAKGVLAKVVEETREVAEAADRGDTDAVAEEIGDLLFSAAQLARHHGVDPEQALRAATRKFEGRFRAMEADEKDLASLDAPAMEAAWGRVKKRK
ncbi:MAG: nucleoside triphosphate pyrophosphohydrolase [Pseudomonadota bacterium]